MTISHPASLDGIRFGVATASLGMHANHKLVNKFDAIAKAGFNWCELGFGEYVAWVREQVPDLPASTAPAEYNPEGGEPDPSDTALWDALYAQADAMKSLAASYRLTIMILQPLNQFDGWRAGTSRHAWARAKAEKWLPLCSKLGVEMIQVGSNDYADADAGDESTADDLRWLAELGARQSPPVKIAYESWCFSKRVNDWEHTWRLVQLGNHPNLGLCLDTAHFPLAPAYGWDPTTGEGWTDKQYAAMLDRMRAIPGDKIFYVELSDVLRPVIPLGKGSPFDEWREKAQSSRGDSFVWAVCGRPVPFIGRDGGRNVKNEDDMGGARVLESVKTILSTGFRGPMMFEFFEAVSMEKPDEDVPYVYANACSVSRRKLLEALNA